MRQRSESLAHGIDRAAHSIAVSSPHSDVLSFPSMRVGPSPSIGVEAVSWQQSFTGETHGVLSAAHVFLHQLPRRR